MRFDVETGTDRDLIREAYTGGNFFLFPKCFIASMRFREAVVMAFLINHEAKVGDKCVDGWFYCKQKTMLEELGLEDKEQRAVLRQLEKLGFIKRKRVGVPPLRYIWVDYMKLRQAIKRDVTAWNAKQGNFPAP